MVKRISKILGSARISPIPGPKKPVEVSPPPSVPPAASPEKPVEVSPPPPVPPTPGPDNLVELLKKQKTHGEGLLKKDFFSLGEVTKWNLGTKDILTKVLGPDSHYIDSVLNAGEHRVYSMYEPESVLEKHRRKNFQKSLGMLEIFIEEFELNRDSSVPDVIRKVEIRVASERQKAAIGDPQDKGKKDLKLSKEPSKTDVSKKVERKEAAENGKVSTVRGHEEGRRETEFSKGPSKSDIIKKIEGTAALESGKASSGQEPDDGKKKTELSKESSKPDRAKKIESPETSESPLVSLVQDPDEKEKELESNKEESKTDESEEIESVETLESQKDYIPQGRDEKERELKLDQEGSKLDATKTPESGEASESQKVPTVHGPDEGKKEIDLIKELSKPHINKRIESMETSESRKVFIVHGHDEEKKEALAKFLTKMDLEPVILHEQLGHGKTLIEKFEHYSDVVFAIILLTGDDYGYPKGKPEESKPRPRQNVVFELGFLMGRFQGQRVCALHEEGLELPSDYQGLVFIPYDGGGIWKLLTARAMKTANIEVDLNKAV